MIDLNDDRKYENVSGWLAFLCINLMFISPIWFLLQLYIQWRHWPALHQKYPNTWLDLSIIVPVWILVIIWASLGVYIGYIIYALQPKGVRWAKSYLMAGFIIMLVRPIASHASLLSIAAPLGWYLYLQKSQQVKRLFPEDAKVVTNQPSPCKPKVTDSDILSEGPIKYLHICTNCEQPGEPIEKRNPIVEFLIYVIWLLGIMRLSSRDASLDLFVKSACPVCGKSGTFISTDTPLGMKLLEKFQTKPSRPAQ